MNDVLQHYGTKRHSGRYPWGSGEDPYQHENGAFAAEVRRLKGEGLGEKEIAEGFGMSIRELRAKITIDTANKRKDDYYTALKLKEKGYSNQAIADNLHVSEGTVRNLLNPALAYKNEVLNNTAKTLKDAVDSKEYIDIGHGVERMMGISRQKLDAAIDVLKDQGYVVWNIQVQQANNSNQKTTVKVLAPEGTTYRDVVKNSDKIRLVEDHTYDGGKTWRNIEPPVSVDSKRIQIKYAEDGGKDKDGVIEIRPGAEDLSLGESRYAQVRIAVDGKYYLKGMAVYNDKLPKGVDIVVNSNKAKGTPKEKVFKEMKDDPENPFGTSLKIKGGQYHYIGKDGKEHLSAINKVNEEGDWANWSKSIASQMLSKQSTELAKQQLTMSLREKQEEYESIMAVTNPVVRKKMLLSFADDCDSSSVHLKAAPFRRQGAHVILPLDTISDKEIYAPNYKNGEKVVLIRFPHGGIFEIPELTVNNNNREGKKTIGTSPIDAVGINHKTAEVLSGADFDGDTVLVIPNKGKRIVNTKPLAGLKNFDPNIYAYPDDYPHKKMTDDQKQKQMGRVSNLITDMTLKGANYDEIAAAVRHSMVVIDAVKHDLNWKQSEIDNNIPALKARYQGRSNAGAATLISRAKSEARVDKRKEQPGNQGIDPKTGEKIWKYTGETYIDKKTGKLVKKQSISTKMAEAKDAFELSSGTPMEDVYASYANQLKSLANKARKDTLSLEKMVYSPSAHKTYEKQVASLDKKLKESESNAPKERQAQLITQARVSMAIKDNPEMTKEERTKLADQTIAAARARVGAGNSRIVITEDEWKAIQAGAISSTKLDSILTKSDLDSVKKLATPREYTTSLTPAKLARAQAMLNAGYTQAEVAEHFGVSVTTLMRNVNG